MFRAKIPHFTSKIVEHSRHLLPESKNEGLGSYEPDRKNDTQQEIDQAALSAHFRSTVDTVA